MAGGWIYFMTNRRNGILCVGVMAYFPRSPSRHGRTCSGHPRLALI
jgi:hypothetical protein